MQLASSASQRLKAVLATRAAAENPVGTATRDQLREVARLAQQALDLKGATRQVLMELAVSHKAVGEGAPIVWPSNARLADKCGVCERAITSTTHSLVAKGLIIRRDSANQKRFRTTGADGREEIYGFDLSPLLRRKAEFEQLVADKMASKAEQKRLHSVIGSERRRAKNALQWLAQHSQANTDELAARFGELSRETPTRKTKAGINPVLADLWATLARDAERLLVETDCAELETLEAVERFASNSSTNDGRNFGHIEPESDLSIEDCKVQEAPRASEPRKPKDDEIDLRLMLEACPAVDAYGQPIRTVHDVVAAASYLRPSTGASAAVWSEGVTTIGVPMTAVATIYVLQRLDDDVSSGANRIENPGGFLRSILRGIATGKVNLKSDLTRMRKRRMQ